MRLCMIGILYACVNVTEANGNGNSQIMGCGFTASVQQPNCPGDPGIINLNFSGGSGSYNYSWMHSSGSPSGSGATSSSTASITVTTSGVYDITMTDANTGCTQLAQVTVNSGPSPITVTATSINNPTCSYSTDGSITLSANGGNGPNYVWTLPPSPPQSGTSTALYSGLGTGTYTVTVADANGCTTTYQFTLTKSAVTASVANVSPDQGCSPSICTGAVTFTAGGGNGGPYQFVWPNNTTTSATATGICDNTYTVTVYDNMNCTGTVAFTVPSNPSSASISLTGSSDATGCGICNGTASVSITAGTAPYTITWGAGTVAVSTTQYTITNLCAGTYQISLTDSLGCGSSTNVTINAPGAPSLNITTTPAICYGGTGTATAVVSGGTGPFSYSWSNGANTSTITAQAGPYSVTITDQGTNCTVSGNVNIPGPSSPLTVTFLVQPPSGCTVSDGQATANPSGGWGTSPSSYTYLWSTSPAQTTQTATGLAAGQYTLTLTDSLGCSITSTVNVPAPGSPSISLIAVVSVACYGDSTGVIAISISGGSSPYTYSWSNGTTVNSPSTTAILTGLAANTYSVTVTDNAGCQSTYGPVSVGGPSAPLSATITGPVTVCTGIQVTYTANASGGTSPYTYTWEIAGTTFTGSVVTVAYPNATSTYIFITVKDGNNCEFKDTLQPINVYQSPVITISGSTTVCEGGSGFLVANAGAGVNYQWNTGSTNDTIWYSGLSQNTTFIVTASNANCSSVDSLMVTVQPQPSVSVSPDMTLCGGSGNIDIFASASSQVVFTWSTGTTYTGTSDTITYSIPAGLQDTTLVVYVTISSQCGTTVEDVSIHLAAPIPVDYPPVITTTYGNAVTISPTGGGNYTSYMYSWAPQSGLNNTGTYSPTATVDSTTTYYVTITDPSNGCSKLDTVIVEVNYLEIKIPDAFSPNGDGKNDVFKVSGSYKDIKIMIWDRWGEKVFDSERDNSTVWDGSYRGKKCNAGNYVYYVEVVPVKGAPIKKHGNLLLVR